MKFLYTPALGRVLQVDPVEGGVDNGLFAVESVGRGRVDLIGGLLGCLFTTALGVTNGFLGRAR